MITIAIPNKGTLSKPAKLLASSLGFSNGVSGEREYSVDSPDGKYRFLLARAKDIPGYVESGSADFGITGQDLVAEAEASVAEIKPLPFGSCKLVYAIPNQPSGPILRVATSFPNLTAKYLESTGVEAKIVLLNGAVEASVGAGMADAIVDLSATGRTLAANGLKQAGVVMESSAVLIANRKYADTNPQALRQVLGLMLGDFEIFKCELANLGEKEQKRMLSRKAGNEAAVEQTVKEVFESVSRRRDEALCEYSEKFDGAKLQPKALEVTAKEIKEAYSQVSGELITALRKSAKNIARFAKREVPTRWEMKTEGGLMGKRIVPLDSVGVYAPGGTAAYPSSVLMGVIPAKAAGVPEIILCTPCNNQGKCNPAVLVAADIAGATRVFRLGGAQAIAAMTIGSRTVPKVAKIVGPGNAFVRAAKLEAISRGLVSIDSPAGPTEVMVIADETAVPAFIAADMLAQAEHGPDAAAILVCTSQAIGTAVEAELKKQLTLLPRREIARKSLSQNGAILIAADVAQAIEFANKYAPEHLELVVERSFAWLEKVRNAGAVFIGNYTCEAAGDYAAGPNHVLPTGGAARSYSGLSARDFVREVNYLKLEKSGLEALSSTIIELANAEGLTAHGRSAQKRFENYA
jgi:histidinol dehydrogenase